MTEGVKIGKCSVAALDGNPVFHDLLAQYASEAAVKGLPEPKAKMEIYRQMENSGTFHVWGAFFLGELVGFISIIAPELPHYGRMVAVSESYFVSKDKRNTGAGLKLLRVAEKAAEELGSPGLLVSAPIDGQLAQLLSMLDRYTETNRVFFTGFAHG